MYLKGRLDLDIDLQEDLQPLLEIKRTVSEESLKRCYTAIAKDCDENTFYHEYRTAADLLLGHDFTNTLNTLQKLLELVPDELPILKLALARVSAAKPHSADVERLISKILEANSYHFFLSHRLSLLSFL